MAARGTGRALAGAAAAAGVAQPPKALIERLNKRYDSLHREFEDAFWATKMGLKDSPVGTGEALSKSKTAYEGFLADPANLKEVQTALEALVDGQDAQGEDQKILSIMEKTFRCYQLPSKEAEDLRQRITEDEFVLQNEIRGGMKLGYVDPKSGNFVKASSVLLRTTMATAEDEETRKAAYDGARSIGPTVAEQFVKVVKMRNKFAKSMGYVDFYDYKCTMAEGFSKATLFGDFLGPLEERSRPIMEDARARLAAEKGEAALKPWNTSQALAGDVTKKQDPYFPFEEAISAWARSFAALGIKYRGATMQLDLLDREGKYSNGFCHWPQCAYVDTEGNFKPSQTNFTSLATPSAVGSGNTALTTLMHEGGHAAHFANIVQGSPFFSQERAPTSVAYAENQSMFLDSLCGDAAWLAKYARNSAGEPIPWELLEEGIRAKSPYSVLALRSMLSVPFFEKALYEMPEADLSAESVQALADDVERKIQGGLGPRPLLSVPHLLSDEASCYYHGYVLAEMSVHQTRAHFLSKYGFIVDNAKIGPDLTEVYWQPGNGEAFLDLVERLTGSALSSDAWIAELGVDLEERVAREKKEYEAAVETGPAIPADADSVDLEMRMVLVHGDTVISSSEEDGWKGAQAKFKKFIAENFPVKA